MINERKYAFMESDNNQIEYQNTVFENMLLGFDTAIALSEATKNYDLLESYSDMLDNCIEDSFLLSEEASANTKYTNIIKSYSYQWRTVMKEGKKLVKENKFKEAKPKFKEALAISEKMLERIKAVKNDTIGSTVKGDTIYVGVLIVISTYLTPALILSVPIIKLFGAKGVAVTLFGIPINTIYNQINLFKSITNNKESNKKSLNFYKNNIEATGKILRDVSAGCVKACDEAVKNNK